VWGFFSAHWWYSTSREDTSNDQAGEINTAIFIRGLITLFGLCPRPQCWASLKMAKCESVSVWSSTELQPWVVCQNRDHGLRTWITLSV